MKKLLVLSVASLTGSVALTLPSLADDAQKHAANKITILKQCTVIPEDAARLACMDKALYGFDFARTIAVLGGRAMQTAKSEKLLAKQKQAFGKPVVAEKGPNLIEDEIKSVRKLHSGKSLFTLMSGQIWRQTDNDNPGRIKAGMKVKIRKGGLGNYLMTITLNRRTLRVKRVK